MLSLLRDRRTPSSQSMNALPGTRHLLRAAAIVLVIAFPAIAADLPKPLLVDALLSGRDTSAQAAQARAHDGMVGRSPSKLAAASPLARFDHEARALHAALARTPQAGDRSRLTRSLEALRASALLVEAEFDFIEQQSLQRAHADAVRQRLARARSHWHAQARPVLAALEQAVYGPDDKAIRQKALQALDVGASLASPVFGTTPPPVHRPRHSPRAPQLTPNIIPSYATSPLAPTQPEDLAASADAPLSATVREQAALLGNDYVAIFDYVRSHVRTEWRAGSAQHVEETLRRGAGNDAEQASLLIALLRASRAPARYVTGVVELPLADLAAQIGVPEAQVGLALAAAGIAHAPVIAGGRLTAFRIEHVWVSAKVPFGNYRGSVADTEEPTWLPLMPALKPAAFDPGAPLPSNWALDVPAFVEEYLSAAQNGLPWNLLRQRLSGALAAQQPPIVLDDLIATHQIDADPLGVLPASTPYLVVAVNLELHELLDAQRQWFTVRVRGGEGASAPVLLEQRLALSAMDSRRLALTYLPATVEDQHLANRRGGMGAFPAYLVRLRPTLNAGGRPIGAGHGIVEAGEINRLELAIDTPAGELSLSQTLLAGTLAVVAIDPAGNPTVEPEPPAEDSDLVASRLLGGFAQRYLQEWSRADQDSAAVLGQRLLHPLPSIVLALPQYRAEGAFGLVDRFRFEGVALDAAARPVEPIALRGQREDEADWLRISALHGSALEAHLYEQLWAVDALSADRALQRAAERGIPIMRLRSGGGTDALSAHPAAVRSHVQAWLSRGYAVDAPRDPITQDAWTGSAWRVHSEDGEAGYFLSGDWAGGVTVIPPGLWYFQDIADALGDPYAAPANDDPLSASLVQLDAQSQYQILRAGEWAPTPLQVYVTDINGLPVKDARVRFALRGPGARLRTPEEEGPIVTVRTDPRGLARVELRAPETGQGLDGGLLRLDGDVNHRRTYISAVDLMVDTYGGPLTPGEPFYSYMVAGDAEHLSLVPQNAPFSNPGLGYTAYLAKASDIYGNEVSNHSVTVSASDRYMGAACQGNFNQPRSGVFLPSQCPVGLPVYTGLPCLSQQVQGLTNYNGLWVNVAPSSIYSTQTTVTATSSAGTVSSESYTRDGIFRNVDGVCETSSNGALLFWLITDARQDAGRLGERLPHTRRINSLTSQGSVGGTSAQWVLTEPLSAVIEVSQGGSATPLRANGVGTRQYELVAGASPGIINGRYHFQLPGDEHPINLNGGIGHAWALDLPAPQVEPPFVDLDPFQNSTHPIRLTAPILPPEYVSSGITLQIVNANGTMLKGCYVADAPAGESCVLERGLRFEPGETYFVRYLVNTFAAYPLASHSAPLPIGRKIVAGFGGYDSADPPPDLNQFIGHRYPRVIELQTELDTQTAYACSQSSQLVYALGQPAVVDIAFYQLDEDGQRERLAWRAIANQSIDEGVHLLPLSLENIDFGVFEYEIKAVAGDVEERHVGRLIHREKRRGSLPLSHPFVKGVDLVDGQAIVSVEDIAIGGRGPGLRFTRTYASHAGNDRTHLGRGWNSDLDSRVVRDTCGTHTVIGAAGQGQRYFPAGQDADGNTLYSPMNGFHGTLVGLLGGGYDFYAKDGTRYHYAEPGADGLRLSFVEDANGNRLTYEYATQSGERVVQRLVDASNRALTLQYEQRTLVRPISGDLELRETRLLVTGLEGPSGLSVSYDYDSHGNLTQARRGGSGGGERVDAYAYDDLGGVWLQAPDGEPRYYHFGFRLTEAKNAVDGSARTYEWGLGWVGVALGGGRTLLIPEQRVITLTEPDGGEIQFAYDGLRGMPDTATTVTDARGASTTYALNVWGGADSIVSPAGTTTTAWNLTHLQPDVVTDPLGATTAYEYDTHGNRIRETLTHPAGTLTRSWTYVSPDAFNTPIKDRVATATDARGHVTQHSYDARGNLLGKTRGGVTERYAHAANGDRISATNGAGEVTQYQYDGHGYLAGESDGIGQRRSATWDARGRMVSETDGTGAITSYGHDALDRRTQTSLPGGGEVQVTYNDAARLRVETDPLGRTTLTRFDAMGRPVAITNAQGDTRQLTYDLNGNLVQETDFRGNATTHSYNSANHRTGSLGPEGRTVAYSVDALGNVLSETVSGAGGSRSTSYAYQHPLNLRTHVRRAGTETITAYDPNGNPIAEMDPNGNITTRAYDERDRLTDIDQPQGRSTRITHDAADRRTSETVSGRERRFEYDARGREVQRIEPDGARWRTAHDGADRPIQRTDPRGGITTLAYDARGQLIREAAPEGRTHQYTYDLAGNRTGEETPDGRDITHTYDALNRRTGSRDAIGPIDTLSHDADGNVLTRTDGNGSLGTSQWNALNQETRRTEPGGRTLAWTHSVHGEVLSETDANGHVTTHSHDALGRRTSTTLPDGSVRRWTYDANGNVLTATDANGHLTTHTYDGLNRRTTQSDLGTQSWTHDAHGNVLTHTDRRGVVTATTHDAADRPLRITRAGLVVQQNTHDAAGNLASRTDANGEVTTYAHDAANRRTRETRPLGATTTWTYTLGDGVASQTDPDGLAIQYEYDPRRRLTTQTDPDGVTTHAYDTADNRTATTRPGGATWTYAYDPAHRLTAIDGPESSTTYEYDAHGNRTAITTPDGGTTTISHDARHRPRSITHPGGVTETFGYDAEGNLVQHTRGNGQSITHAYDALNRRTSSRYAPTAPGDVAEETFDYDPNGNLTRLTQDGQATTRTYDAHDRLTAETDRHGQTTQSVHDAAGRRISRTDAEGGTTFQRDALGRIVRLTPGEGGAITLSHTPGGRLTGLTHPNGATTEHTHDALGRIQTLTHRQNGAVVSTTTYTYDARGNRTGETHTGNQGADGQGTRTLTHVYDQEDRLTQTRDTAPDGSTTTTTYTLNPAGSRVRETVTRDATTLKDTTYTHGPRQQLEQSVDAISGETITYVYDGNGALTQETKNGQTTTYRQNAQDRLATLTLPGAPPIHYAYDAEGRRIEKLTHTEGRRYVWDGQRIRRETNVTGNALTSYEWAGGRILRSRQGAQHTYAQHDALGSPVRWSRQDGGEQGRTRYGAWGETEQQQGSVPPIGYTGHYKDAETGDYYAQQRYYRPRIGRFTRIDPWEGDYQRPITLNKYLYANGNPLLFMDPTGLYGIFFDGTWNDGPNTIGSSQHTNVYRLSRLYDWDRGGRADYQLGVGTSRLSQVPGGATGLGARSRIDDAYDNLVNWYNSPEAREMRANDPERWEQARQIDVFGFSRGSAQAREFTNLLKKKGIPNHETGEKFADVNVRFLGIFDTVAAMGVPTNGVNLTYDMRVDPSAVRNVRHAVAADEFRRSFDLVSIGTDYDTMPAAHLKERYFRGAHSSVGGGYGPDSQGKPNSLARATLHWMHAEASAAGVPLGNIVGDDSALPHLDQLNEEEIREKLIHDSRRGWTGTLERIENRQRRTIYYPSSGKKETVSREELVRRWRASEQSSAFVVKESEDELILEPLEEN